MIRGKGQGQEGTAAGGGEHAGETMGKTEPKGKTDTRSKTELMVGAEARGKVD